MKIKNIITVSLALILVGLAACENEREYMTINSNFDNHTSDSGGDYYAGEGIDVSMYGAARIFPGLADTLTEKHLEEAVVTIDLSKEYVDNTSVGLKAAPPAIYSTGLYAGAGEKITIMLDEEVNGLSVQIGVHQRDLTKLKNSDAYMKRSPLIVTSTALFKGINEIRNPYGGYIWIRRSGSAVNRQAVLRVKGAYQAPDYIQGETNAEEWIAAVKQTTVPWAELRAKYVTFTVPVARLKEKVTNPQFVADMDKALKVWSDVVESILEFYGMDGEDPAYPKPGFPIRSIMEAQIITQTYSFFGTENSTTNSDAIELLNTAENFNMLVSPTAYLNGEEDAANFMGWLTAFCLSPLSETSPWSLNDDKIAYYQMPHLHYLWKDHFAQGYKMVKWIAQNDGSTKGRVVLDDKWTFDLPPIAFQLIADVVAEDGKSIRHFSGLFGDKYLKENGVESKTIRLAALSQIMGYRAGEHEREGWKFFSFFSRWKLQLAQKTDAESIAIQKANAIDKLLYALTDYFEEDWSSWCDRWGFALTNESRAYAMQKPHLTKQVWQYDLTAYTPLEDYDGSTFYTQSGKAPMRHMRGDWNCAAYGVGKGYTDDILGDGMIDDKYTGLNYKSETQAPEMLIDGKENTYWESYSDHYASYYDKEEGQQKYAYYQDSLYWKAKTPELEYYVVFGFDEPLTVDGIYMVLGGTGGSFMYDKYMPEGQRNWSYAPKNFILEATTDELYYVISRGTITNAVGKDAVQWTTIYDSSCDDQYQRKSGSLFFIDFNQRFTGLRGMRMVIKEPSHYAADKPVWWEEEYPSDQYPNRPDTNHELDRIQRFAEFGTYYYEDK